MRGRRQRRVPVWADRLPDRHVQQHQLLGRCGVCHLLAPDTTAPTVTARTPAPGATGVAVSTAVTATFSENMDAATLTDATFKLTDPGNTVKAAAVSYSAATLTATLQPNAPLAQSTTYTARLTGGASGIRTRRQCPRGGPGVVVYHRDAVNHHQQPQRSGRQLRDEKRLGQMLLR